MVRKRRVANKSDCPQLSNSSIQLSAKAFLEGVRWWDPIAKFLFLTILPYCSCRLQSVRGLGDPMYDALLLLSNKLPQCTYQSRSVPILELTKTAFLRMSSQPAPPTPPDKYRCVSIIVHFAAPVYLHGPSAAESSEALAV